MMPTEECSSHDHEWLDGPRSDTHVYLNNTGSMGISGTDLLEVPTIYVWPIFQA